MVYKVEGVVRDVRVCIDQNMESAPLVEVGDVDTLALDEIIRSKVVEGVERVHLDAPNYLLESGHNFGETITWREMESGWVLLPKDFMRLVVFEMSDWEQAVYHAITTDDPDYEKQRSRVKGIRGTAQRPVCAIAIRPVGRVLEFYSCKSDEAEITRAMYLPYPTIDSDGGIDICERCYRAAVYMIAGLSLVSMGESERAKEFFELSKNWLQ